MLKKLSAEKLEELLEAAVEEFARRGPDGASMRDIADRAGISVGVLYKYYENKEALFRACLDRSLEALNVALEEVTREEGRLMEYSRRIVRRLLRFSGEHPGYVRLYCSLTATESAARLAGELESASAGMFTRCIAAGQASGDLRQDVHPGMFAFFFDSLLMMIQFTGCCGYYRERFRLYCGGTPEELETLVEEELLKFFESAFTFEASQVVHREAGAKAPVPLFPGPPAPRHGTAKQL